MAEPAIGGSALLEMRASESLGHRSGRALVID
jgi:hypothetical protein